LTSGFTTFAHRKESNGGGDHIHSLENGKRSMAFFPPIKKEKEECDGLGYSAVNNLADVSNN
jgi:hypothetical protein